jgi:hypothetical protein
METSYATGIADPCRYFTEFIGSVCLFQHSHCTAHSLTQLKTVQCSIRFPASTMTGYGLVLIWATNILSCLTSCLYCNTSWNMPFVRNGGNHVGVVSLQI